MEHKIEKPYYNDSRIIKEVWYLRGGLLQLDAQKWSMEAINVKWLRRLKRKMVHGTSIH